MKVKLYVEGGGDSKSLQVTCREGFRKLLERAGFKGRMPSIVACGSRYAAFDDFQTALRQTHPGDYPMLLVDSEAPVSLPPWEHLARHDRWTRPSTADDGQVHLMVQCMETWCLADRLALKHFFGQLLNESALPGVVSLEGRAKDDVQQALAEATRTCGHRRADRKGKRSFELLGRLDPAELRKYLPHFVRLCDYLDRALAPE